MSRRHSDSALSLKEASRRVIASRTPRLLRGLKNCDLHFLGFFLTGNPRPLKQPQLSAARHDQLKLVTFPARSVFPSPRCVAAGLSYLKQVWKSPREGEAEIMTLFAVAR